MNNLDSTIKESSASQTQSSQSSQSSQPSQPSQSSQTIIKPIFKLLPIKKPALVKPAANVIVKQEFKPFSVSAVKQEPNSVSTVKLEPNSSIPQIKLQPSLTTTTSTTTTTTTTTTAPYNNTNVKKDDSSADFLADCKALGNNTYLINGYSIKFPFQPYECQSTMMHQIIEALKNGTNALLESATGTGKTLSLLCAALEWQTVELNNRKKIIQQRHQQREKDKNEKKKLNKTNNKSPTTKTTATKRSKSSPIRVNVNTTFVVDEQFDDDGLQSDIYMPKQMRTTSPTTSSPPTNKNYNNKRSLSDSNITTIKKKKLDDKNHTTINCDEDEDEESTEDEKEVSNNNNRSNSSLIINNGNIEDDDDESTDEEEKMNNKIDDDNLLAQVPCIFFCSRTHSQIKQLTDELLKTPYRPSMTVLGSREHYCINPKLANSFTKKDKCNKLVKAKECRYHKPNKQYSVIGKYITSGQGIVWDMEQLKLDGQELKECPYFAARSMIPHANLIFCPYNYIIDNQIRNHFKQRFQNSIVIFDEAHNIEDALMAAASCDIVKEDLQESVFQNLKPLIMESLLPMGSINNIKTLFQLGQDMIKWLDDKINTLKDIDFEKQSNVWHGVQILGVLNDVGIHKGNYRKIIQSLNELIEEDDANDSSSNGAGGKNNGHLMNQVRKEMGLAPVKSNRGGDKKMEILTPKTVSIFEEILKAVNFLFEYPEYVPDFKLVVQKQSDFLGKGEGTKWKHTFSIWSMNPRVAFKSISENTRSVILTSGTLSPLSSFSSELGAPFPVTAQLGNLNDITKRVWIGTLGFGVNNTKLDCTFKSTDLLVFQDALGSAILKHIQFIPDGVLVFFPSYAFLDKMVSRWKKTGLYDQIDRIKPIFSEPKFSKDFPPVLNEYNKVVNSKKGALLFSIYRGKVSEGINFSDQFARGVIIIGIPYPNFKDLRVDLKKKYNESNTKKGMMSGKAWYDLQAYRALNQALGRCIRHKDDYGSILLIDERFTNSSLWVNFSKWARVCITNNKYQDASITSLKNFFIQRKEIENSKAQNK